MSVGFWISVLIIGPVVLFVIWLVLVDASVRIDPGTLGLMLKRGRAAGRVLEPGRHFVVPFRKVLVQRYPSRELSYVAGTDGSEPVSENDYADVAVPCTLGDRTSGLVAYTVRCRLDRSCLREVHDRFGPEGIWPVIRDDSRRCVIGELAAADVGAADAFGDRFVALEARLAEALRAAMGDTGFELTMFSLRRVDLGVTEEVVQSIARVSFEIEREVARTALRLARAEHDVDLGATLGDVDELALRYRQLEAWQDLLERWGGGSVIPAALTAPLLRTGAGLRAAAEAELAQRDRDAEAALEPEATAGSATGTP